jgi:asparagine synthase (glutamine-hydrolysing)
MCGIAGYYDFNASSNPGILEEMTGVLHHRGPDANGYFSEEKVGLGHQRLKIIDLSDAANQPMTSRNGQFVIVFNGEVYNYTEIANDLQIPLKTNSDTEVVLEAFALEGIACLNRFNGMFAFAVYDKKEKNLTLARDRIGIKPLFYFKDNEQLLFASELKAIKKAKPGLQINEGVIASFLHYGYIPEPYTIYENVLKFPAGHYMECRDGKTGLKQWWSATEKINNTVLSNQQSAKTQLNVLLQKSVKYRLMSDVPFGTFLSGGIDSSLITAIAQSVSDKPIKTFSIGFREAKYDESVYAKSVSDYLKTDHHPFVVTYRDAIDLMEGFFHAYDEPFADSSGIPTMLVSKLARQHVTMTLSGDGGDELFFGYGAYHWAKRLQSPFLNLFRKPLSFGLGMMSDRYKRIGKLIDFPSGERLPGHIFSQEQYYFSEAEINTLMTNPEKVFRPGKVYLNRTLTAVEEQALFDLQYYLKDDLLVKVDRASMHYSLETRVPLLDHNIVEFALNLSPELKIRNGESKYLLKQVLYDYVPAKYFDRPKWGFSIPLNRWLKNELRHWLEDYTSKQVIEQHGLVRYDEVAGLKKKYLQGQDHLYNRLWLIVVLHKFLS